MRDLSCPGRARDAALAELGAILRRGLSRALAGWVRTSGREFEALADDFVQEALLKILDGLEGFRGLSRFTTWAHKIAVREALSELRRRRWKDISLDEAVKSGHVRMTVEDSGREADLTFSLEWLRRAMEEDLTEKQRSALLAVVFGGMPFEEAARRMGTNRNAMYKLLHDARLRLRRRLTREGMSVHDIMAGTGQAGMG